MTVMSQHRFDPGLVELKRLIDAGALGRLPHLTLAGRAGGFSGPAKFRQAAQALKRLLDDLSIGWQ